MEFTSPMPYCKLTVRNIQWDFALLSRFWDPQAIEFFLGMEDSFTSSNLWTPPWPMMAILDEKIQTDQAKVNYSIIKWIIVFMNGTQP